MKQGYFKTKKRLEVAIDNSEKINGMDEYLDSSFAYLMFDLDYGSDPNWDKAMFEGYLFEVPYWALEGSIDYAINGRYDYDPEHLMAEYVSGYYEPNNYGDILTRNNKEYKYIASVSLPNEMEHQADDGGLVYEYRGSSFMRILEPLDKVIDKYPV